MTNSVDERGSATHGYASLRHNYADAADEIESLRSRLAAAEALLREVNRQGQDVSGDVALTRAQDIVGRLRSIANECVDLFDSIEAFLKETAP